MKQILLLFLDTVKKRSSNIRWVLPFIFLCIWTMDAFISIFNTGFISFNIWFLISIVFKVVIIILNMYILWSLFIKEKKELYKYLKTYVGYSIVIVYIVYALPRMSWEFQNSITESHAFLLWIFNFISMLFPLALYIILWLKTTQLSWGVISESDLKKNKKEKKVLKTSGKKTLKEKIIENIHVIVQAIIIVILIQHFFLQLYLIPTESMVPTFLINDRPFVFKFLSGPTIPLTDWKLPSLVKAKRGNIVVFESPTYEQNDMFKKIFHHFIFLSTLSLVDIDLDENGRIRKRFIVKRIIGEPGEKLKMVDDVVYVKKKGESTFQEIEADRNKYAHVNLYNEKPGILKNIRYIPIRDEVRKLLSIWDEEKNKISISSIKNNIEVLVESIKNKLANVSLSGQLIEHIFTDCWILMNSFLNVDAKGKYYFYLNTVIRNSELAAYLNIWKRNEYSVFLHYFNPNESIKENEFTSQTEYELNGKKVDYIFQKLVLKKIDRYIDLRYNKDSINYFGSDEDLSKSIKDLLEFYVYMDYYDYRNFPEFPQGEDNYIPEGNYFLLGDNRYNSLDFRFSHENGTSLRAVSQNNIYSFVYPSKIHPFLLPERKILGFVAARVWPLNRFSIF